MDIGACILNTSDLKFIFIFSQEGSLITVSELIYFLIDDTVQLIYS